MSLIHHLIRFGARLIKLFKIVFFLKITVFASISFMLYCIETLYLLESGYSLSFIISAAALIFMHYYICSLFNSKPVIVSTISLMGISDLGNHPSTNYMNRWNYFQWGINDNGGGASMLATSYDTSLSMNQWLDDVRTSNRAHQY